MIREATPREGVSRGNGLIAPKQFSDQKQNDRDGNGLTAAPPRPARTL
jgi:hypothetical protein